MESISHSECVHLKFIKEKMPEVQLLLHYARQLPTKDIIDLINTAIQEKTKLEGKNSTINNQKGTGDKIRLLTSYRPPAGNQWLDSPLYDYPEISQCNMGSVDAKASAELDKVVIKAKRKYKKREKKGEKVDCNRAEHISNMITKGKLAAEKTSNLALKRKGTNKPTSSSIKKEKFDQVNF